MDKERVRGLESDDDRVFSLEMQETLRKAQQEEMFYWIRTKQLIG